MSDRNDIGNDTLEEYMDLKRPEGREKFQRVVNEALRERLAGRTIEQAERQRDDDIADAYQEYIKDGAPFTGKEIVEWRKALSAKRRAENFPPSQAKKREQRTVALRAFLKIDMKKGDSGEATNLALDEIEKQCSSKVTRNAVSRWLQDIIGFTDIQKLPRGARGKGKK